MANRRSLKKHINYICSELFAECVVLQHSKKGIDRKETDQLMTRILLMHDEFIRRISHTEPGCTKKFYRQLHTDFNAQVDDVVNAISRIC